MLRSLKPNVCPLCDNPSKNRDESMVKTWIDCEVCGAYGLTESAVMTLYGSNLPQTTLFSLSAFTREQTILRTVPGHQMSPPILLTNPGVGIAVSGTTSLQDAFDNFPKTISGRLDKTLLNLGRLSEYPGHILKLPVTHYSIAYAENQEAFLFCLTQLANDNLLNVEVMPRTADYPQVMHVVMSARGWNKFAELERGYMGQQPRQAFVAMAYAPEMQAAYDDGIEVGVRAAGYEPKRIDRIEFNNKIDDEIIAEIRKSRFLVADFTKHRGGVYFEAGFALGLGMQVIWTCRNDDVSELHFDTRQYNHIVWSNPGELALRLEQRIEATLGRPTA